ncbi:MAG: response regulator, partial [bacterium]
KIKSNPKLKETILIMLTSVARRGDAKRLDQAGFAAYLTKPVRQSLLLETLAAVWGAKTNGVKTALVTRHSLAESRAVKVLSAKETNPENRIRVPLVEDNIDNQKLGRKMLEKLGCQVNIAANGREAVNMLKRLPYDLVFMDCQMPEMDGYEATIEIRKWEREKRNSETENGDSNSECHIPIIAMTANAMKEDEEKCLAAGMDDYISKPVSFKKLKKVMMSWTSGMQRNAEDSFVEVKVVDAQPHRNL